jgi:ABC-2 type transport system permease protein
VIPSALGGADIAGAPTVPAPAAGNADRGLPPIRPFTVAMASVRRDWGTARSYRFPLVLTGVQLFVSLASYFFLGRLVGHGVVRSVGSQLHQGFFAFAIVGSTMLSIVATTMLTFARRLRTDQTTGTLEVMLISPSPAWLVLPASASYELVFSAVSSFATVAVGAAFFGLRFDVSSESTVVAILAILGALVFFCAMGIAFSGFILVFKRGEGIMSLVTAAFSLLGGVLYPIQLLPTVLRWIADALPFTWVLEVLRAALLDRTSEWLRLGEVWVAGIVLVPIAMWVFHTALRRARYKGTLAQY